MIKKVLFFFLFCLIHLSMLGQFCKWVPEQPVREIDYPISDWAITNNVNGEWVIFYNQKLLNALPASVRLFTKAHEYAHIELRHLLGINQAVYKMIKLIKENELAADTQAAEWLLDSGCRQVVSEMAEFFSSIQYRNAMLPPWYPSYTERRDNLLGILEDAPEPIEFSIEIPLIRAGELGGVIDIWIDNTNVGTISNFDFDYENSIDLNKFRSGMHEYRLRVKVYGVNGPDSIYLRTISGTGNINIQEFDTWVVSYGASNPILLKNR